LSRPEDEEEEMTTMSHRNRWRRGALSLILGVIALSLVALGCGSSDDSSSDSGPIKLGVITDLTGPIASAGQADANIAKLAVDDINANGGLLGRQVELVTVDSASDPKVAVTKAQELVQREDVDVVIGGITSDTRNAIKGTITERGGKLYIFPNGGEGGQCDENLYVTGLLPPQQAQAIVPYLTGQGAKKWYLVGSDYTAPREIDAALKEEIQKEGGEVVGESYAPIDATDYSAIVSKIMSSGADVVHAIVIPPGVTPFFQQLTDAGFVRQGGQLAGVFYDDGTFAAVPPEQMNGLVSSLDYYQSLTDGFDRETLQRYNAQFDGEKAPYAATGGAQAMYRAVLMWAQAVRDAGSADTDAVSGALDQVKIDEGPGGPAEMLPGQHHPKMNVYIGQAENGKFIVKKNAGAIEPPPNC
jgi:ABC-type branched-subunit amino acid transport system substrate-binding protein